MQKGEIVRVSYTGKMKESGETFDKGEEVPMVVGAGFGIPGLEEALEQMKMGEKRTVEVSPTKGFGEHNNELVSVVPEAEMKRHNVQPKQGMSMDTDRGRCRVVSVANGRVTLDFNHPLAGKTLIYEIEVKEKIENKTEQVKAMVQIFTRMEPSHITVDGNVTEITMPPLLHPVMKKRLADEIRRHAGIDTIKFIEVFEKPKADTQKKE